jgi:hypothetical protein
MSTINNHRETHSTQDKIVKYVNEIPGIRYRELLRMTGLSNGVLSYHLRSLDNSGKILVNRVNNRVTRYSLMMFPPKNLMYWAIATRNYSKNYPVYTRAWSMWISRYHSTYEKSSFYYILAHGKIKSC